MKKHLLIVICAILVVAFTSISLLVYIDLFKPSIHGAEKAYNNQEYQKAESIYIKVLESSSDDFEIDAVIGLAETYITLEKFDECEDLLKKYYEIYPNRRRIIKQIAKFYSREGYEKQYKNLLIDLYNRKDKKTVNKLVKKPKNIMVSTDSEEVIPISNFIFQLTNSFRNQNVNITVNNKKQDVENIIKSAILYNNLNDDPDENSVKIFEAHGQSFNANINLDSYRVVDLKQASEKVLDLYDFNKFSVSGDAFIYRIVDSSGMPDIFKYNTLIFAKYASDDRKIVYYPIVEILNDKMTGRYVVEGSIYRFDVSEFDVGDVDKSSGKKAKAEYREKKKVFSLYSNWKNDMSTERANKLSVYSERLSRFQAVLRQTEPESSNFKVVSYKTK